MSARIYKPAKTAMQSGKAKTENWVVDFAPETPRKIDPLMGYTSSSDMKSQIRMKFPTKEQAIAYCQKHGIAYQLHESEPVERRKISYSDNFRYDRRIPWTH